MLDLTFLHKNWGKLTQYSSVAPASRKLGDEALQANCLRIWEQASKSVFPFFLIGPGIRKDVELVSNFGLLAFGNEQYPQHQRCNEKEFGAIFGAKPWFQLLNDVFIFAGIQQGKEFHIPYDDLAKIPKKRLWDQETDSITAFGREILFLSLAQYRWITREGINICFIPPEKKEEISLLQLQKKAAAISSYDQLRVLFQNWF